MANNRFPDITIQPKDGAKLATFALNHNREIGGTRFKGCTGTIPSCLVASLDAWRRFAIAHENRFESPIGHDYVLGPGWIQWAAGMRTLLNGDTGGLDCGTLDAFILDTLRAHDVPAEMASANGIDY